MAKTRYPASARPTLLMLAVENFNNRRRSDADRSSMRKTVQTVIENTLEKVFPAAANECDCHDTEHGIEMLIPSKVAKSELLSTFMPELELGIEEYNDHCSASATCRLRAVFHLAEDGSASSSCDFAARLLASNFLRLFLLALPKGRSVALLVSDEYYSHLQKSPKVSMSREFRRARIQTEENVPLTVWAYHYPRAGAVEGSA